MNKTGMTIRSWVGEKGADKRHAFTKGNIIVILVTLFALVVDFIVTISRYDQVFAPTRMAILIVVTAGAVFVLDVPPALIGAAVKKFHGKKNSALKSATVIICGMLLVIGLTALNLLLTYELRSVMFENPVTASAGIFETEIQNSGPQTIAAVITGLIPLGTSIVCFIVSLLCSNSENATSLDNTQGEVENLRQEIYDLEADLIHGCALYPETAEVLKLIEEGKSDSEVIGSLAQLQKDSIVFAKEADCLKARIRYVWACEDLMIQGYLAALADSLQSGCDNELIQHALEKCRTMEEKRISLEFSIFKKITDKSRPVSFADTDSAEETVLTERKIA